MKTRYENLVFFVEIVDTGGGYYNKINTENRIGIYEIKSI